MQHIVSGNSSCRRIRVCFSSLLPPSRQMFQVPFKRYPRGSSRSRLIPSLPTNLLALFDPHQAQAQRISTYLRLVESPASNPSRVNSSISQKHHLKTYTYTSYTPVHPVSWCSRRRVIVVETTRNTSSSEVVTHVGEPSLSALLRLLAAGI